MKPQIAIAAILALSGFQGMPTMRCTGSKERCAECDCKIPPGRAGRRCEPCRAAQTTGVRPTPPLANLQ